MHNLKLEKDVRYMLAYSEGPILVSTTIWSLETFGMDKKFIDKKVYCFDYKLVTLAKKFVTYII